MSTTLKFELDAQSLQFEAGADYPASRPVEIIGVQDRTAAGTLQYEKLGIVTARRVLKFDLMSQTDYTALIDWFLNVAEAGRNEFTFTDEYGNSDTVKIIDQILSFSEVSLQRYTGTLTLEYTDYA